MIEEYMVIANMLAAKKVTDTCKDLALIRNHRAPGTDKI